MSKIKIEYKIAFKDFQKIVMDFQIKSRDKYMKNFVLLFRKSDTDNNGIINEEEFFEFLKNLNIYDDFLEENAIRLLNIIDPHNHKQIIFSECVSLFKMVIVFFPIIKFINLSNRKYLYMLMSFNIK
jgi:Ca2+-binding EF-hand superfamily protein